MSYASCLEADKYFEELDQNKDALSKVWTSITQTVNEALSCRDYDRLLSLIPYMEEGDGSLAFSHIGESRRLLQALHIIELERKYHKAPFSINCSTLEELTEKYMLTLFALRRLQFEPSESAVSDAIFYLTQNEISVFAIYIITQRDLIIPTPSLYDKVLKLFSEIWPWEDQELFASFFREKNIFK